MRSEDAAAAERIIELSLSITKAGTMSGIYERVAPGNDGRIRSVLSPVGTVTGRFSHSETFLERSTNLANIPKKMVALDPLYDVRRCMVPRAGHAFVEADLGQAEARYTCAYAGDVATLARFASGEDVHRYTASLIFKCAPEAVTKPQRYLGKMARHALNYGMGWSLFLERINKDADLSGIAITAAQAKEIVDGYRAANPQLLAWWDEVWAKVQRDGCLVNAFGRRIDFLSPYVQRTDAIAYLPQSGIADLMNWRISVAYEKYPMLRRSMLLQIHDALLCEVPVADVPECARQLRECLEVPMEINGITLTVPADVHWSTDSWGALEGM